MTSSNGAEFEMSKFVRNLHEMISDDNNSRAVGFSPDGISLELRDADYLSQVVLPKYFKHGNISSLTRQLNNYGFKTNPPRANAQVTQSFTHPYFCRGRVDLYSNVKRRPAASAGREEEVEKKVRMEETTSLPLPPPSSAAAAASATPSQQQHMLHNSNFASATASNRPTYQQLMDLNARLQSQNVMLEERVRQLEEMIKTRPVQPQYMVPSQPMPVPPQPQQQAPQPPSSYRNAAMRMSGEQARSLFPAVTNRGIRSSGEQARNLFGEETSTSLDDEDVVTLKNMFLRTSMDEDQAL